MNKSYTALVAGSTMLLAGCVAYGQPMTGGHYGGDRHSPGHGRQGYPVSGSVIRCESQRHRTQHCRVDTRGGVSLVRQLSDQPCVRGRNWGHDRNGVWVSQGCRAEFSIGRGNAGYGNSHGPRPFPQQAAGRTVRCESSNHGQRRCNLPVQHTVTLVRQLSSASCVRGRTWGWDRNGVWVDRGCRAEFAVR